MFYHLSSGLRRFTSMPSYDASTVASVLPTPTATANAGEQRWRSLLSSIALMLTSGSIYLFSSYSAALAELLNLTTSQLNFAGSAANVGTWLSLGGGMFCDVFGPRACGAVGATLASGTARSASPSTACYPTRRGRSRRTSSPLPRAPAGRTYSAKTAFGNFHVSDRGGVSVVCFFALCSGLFSHT